MKSKFLVWGVGATSALALALGTVSWGQSNRPVYLSGLINDFTPGSINGQLVGPWLAAPSGDSGVLRATEGSQFSRLAP